MEEYECQKCRKVIATDVIRCVLCNLNFHPGCMPFHRVKNSAGALVRCTGVTVKVKVARKDLSLPPPRNLLIKPARSSPAASPAGSPVTTPTGAPPVAPPRSPTASVSPTGAPSVAPASFAAACLSLPPTSSSMEDPNTAVLRAIHQLQMSVDAGFDKVTADIKAIVSRLSQLETATATIREEMSELSKRQDLSTDAVASLAARVSALEALPAAGESPSPALLAVNDVVRSNALELTQIDARVQQIEVAQHTTELIISGLPEAEGEAVPATVGSLAAALGVATPPGSILECRRMRGTVDPNRPRAIFVRLASSALRDSLVAAKRRRPQLRACDITASLGERPVQVHEFLPRSVWTLLRDTRVVARDEGYKYVWVRGGRVYARRASGTAAILISSKDDFSKIC